MARKSEMMDAIEALAKAKDISVDQIVSAVEEGCKAAYRKYVKRGSNAPMNLSVVLSREHDVQIFARKVVSEEVEDENQQISLEDARALRPNYEVGDIVELDVTPADFGRVAAQTAKQVIRQRLQDVEKGKIYDEYIEKENETPRACMWNWAGRKASWTRSNSCPARNTAPATTSRSM